MGFTQDLFTSRRNYDDGTTRIGQAGRIWYDHDSGSFRVSDGVTAGGSSIGPSHVNTAGIGLSVDQPTGNITISSNATHLPIPNTIVARSATNTSNVATLYAGNVTVTGNLLVLGKTTYLDYSVLAIEDKFLTLANISPPYDLAADGGGLILKGNVDHTLLWVRANSAWTSTENIDLVINRNYRINNIPVLSSNTLFATTSLINIAPLATQVNIAATGGNTRIRSDLHIDGNLTVSGKIPINREFDYIHFDTTLANPGYLEGTLFYDSGEKALSYYADDADLTVNIGRETVMRVINLSGITIFSGNAVYISGAAGDKPSVTRAQANNYTTAQVVGIATTDMLQGEIGYITVNGIVHDVNTAGMTAGAKLYLSPTIAGAYTTTKPTHPNYEVELGYVTRSNANNGHFEVAINSEAFDQLMVIGEANFESNVVVDRNLTVTGNLIAAGSHFITNSSTYNLANTTATTINFAGQATSLNMSASTGTTTIRNNLVVDAGLTLTGNIITPSTLINVVNTNATTVNFAGAAQTLNIGSSLGKTTVNNSLEVGNDFTVKGTTTKIKSTVVSFDDPVLTIGGELAPISDDNKDRGIEFRWHNGSSAKLGFFGWDDSAQAFTIIPDATNSSEIFSGSAGNIAVSDINATNLVLSGSMAVNGGQITTTAASASLLNGATTISAFAGATAINLGAATGTTTLNHNLVVDGILTVNGANLNVATSTFNLAPTATDLRIGQVTGTTRVRNNLEVDGDIMIDGGYLNASTLAFNMLNSTVTYATAFGSATTLVLAAPTGTTNVRNNLEVDANIEVSGGAITVTTPTFALANSVASSVNAFGSAQNINIGSVGGFGTLTLRNYQVSALGNLAVGGGAVSTSKTTFDLINSTANVINFAGEGTTVNIGSALGFGTTNILNDLYVTGNLLVNGNNVTFNSAVSVVNDPVIILGGVPPASLDDNKDRGIQFTWHTGTVPKTGFFGWDDSQQLFTFIPDANNLGDIYTGVEGAVKFGPITGNTGTFTSQVDVQGNLLLTNGRMISSQSLVNLVETSTTVNLGAAATDINLGSTNGVVNVLGDLQVRGGDITTNQTSFNLVDTTATTANIAGAATNIRLGATTGNLNIRNANTLLDGVLEIRGNHLYTTQSTFNLVNNTATTLNLAGAATTINVGASNGTTNLFGNLEVRNQNITTNQSLFNLVNTVATTLNIGGAASTINIGAPGGTLTIRNDNLVLDGDLQIKGGDLTTNLSSFNLVNTNAIAVNMFGAATSIIMGATTGVTNIRNNLDLDGTLNVDGSTFSTTSSSFSFINTNATNISAFGAGTVLTLGATTGSTTIRNSLNVNNNIDVLGSINIDNNLTVDGAVNIDGLVDIDNSLDVANNLNVGNNLTVVGTLTIGSPGFNSTSITFNLLNTYTTTINAFGAATLVEIGSTLGKTSINNELEVEGAAITTSRASIDVLNTTATTVNFAGAATALTMGATTGTTRIRNNLDVDLDLNLDGGDLTVSGTTFNLANTNATTVNAFGAATTISLGATTGTTTIRNDLTVKGSLTVEGTLTTIDSVTVTVDDKNIELGSVLVPTDATADGGGITLRGTTQKTIIWDQVNTNWTSSEHWNIATGKSFKINNVSMLDATTLGSTVINSSLRTLGTINTGVWQGTVIAGQYGGTGVNNTGKTISLGGNFATINHNLTLVLTGASTITLPTTGTVATLAEVETFTNKTINLTNNTLTGTLAEFNTALSGADFASLAGTETLTNKTINLANNTLTGTLAQFNSALSGDDFASLTGAETLTNKSINLANNTLTGTLAQFNSALSGADFASLAGSETLTNKSISLTNNTLSGTLAEFNSALSGADFASLAGSETLTNKGIALANNTLSGTKAQFDSACSDGNFAYHSDKLDVFAATTSLELAGVISDETGTGKLVFADDATLKNVTISDVINLTPIGSAPASPQAGMIAVANNAGGGWDPAGVGGSVPYPVFYNGTTWVKMTP